MTHAVTVSLPDRKTAVDSQKYLCEACGGVIESSRAASCFDGDVMVGLIDVFSHVCVDGWEVHPFSITPFPDSADALSQKIGALPHRFPDGPIFRDGKTEDR